MTDQSTPGQARDLLDGTTPGGSMTTFNSALFVINEVYADEYVKQHMTPLKVTQALADADLLAPDPTYRSAPLVGMTWDEEDGVPDGYVHLTFRVPETGRGFSAKDTATINLDAANPSEGELDAVG